MWMDTEQLERMSELRMKADLGIEWSLEEFCEMYRLMKLKEECIAFWESRKEPKPKDEFDLLIEGLTDEV